MCLEQYNIIYNPGQPIKKLWVSMIYFSLMRPYSRNINAFNPDYVPENYLHRESQMEALAICLRPALRGGHPINTVVLGSPATGKTTAINKIFGMVEGTSNRVVCVYVNCQLHTTRFNIFSQIFNKIFGHMPPETGVPFSRIYGSIMKHLQSEEKSMVVALDDVSYLFHSKNANKIFYDILRAHEEFKGLDKYVCNCIRYRIPLHVWIRMLTRFSYPRNYLRTIHKPGNV